MNYDTINDARTIAGNGEGTLFAGRYRVVRQLGQGGMGSVWLAEDTQLDNKLFAIKMLPAILVANTRAYRQLKDEALVAMKLTHPNIVTLRAFEENNGNPFLVMDYIDGQTLDDYLAEHSPADATPADVARPPRPCCKGEGALATSPGTTGAPRPPQVGLPEADVLRILRPIAAALDYAHAKGVVHRDVKPGNVMIAKDGTPYILDFGIAREIQETMTRVTGKLSSGTLLYMSPEQLMGESPKPAQDIYSFAAMAYECLKGEPPFSHGQIEFQIMSKQPEPPPGGTQLVASVLSGLAKKPADRPPTCSAVLVEDDFSHKERKDRKDAGAVAFVATERKTGGVWKILFAAALLALMGVGVGVWYHLQELKHERELAGQKAEEKRRNDEMLARQKASANEKKDKSENVLAELRKEGAKDYGGESFRKIESLHAAGRSAFSRGMYTDAIEQFDEMIKAESDCKQEIEQAKKQEREKRAEENAEKMRDEAESAKKNAEDVNAKIYAERSWNNAVKSLTEANGKFVNGDFPVASNAFAIAVRQFEICINEANAALKAKEAVIPIRDQALDRQGRLMDISGDEEIEASKNDLVHTFARADTLFSDKERRWSEAAALFTNYVTRANNLIQLYEERRQAAVAARTKAETAKKRAEKEDAEQFAKTGWKNAVKRMESANDEFKKKGFASAANIFNSVAAQFDLCADEAKNNKAVQALLGTWECSMRKEGITTTPNVSSIRATAIITLFYNFDGNGAYTLKMQMSHTEHYPVHEFNGSVSPAKTGHTNATVIDEGKWSLQGNVLTLRELKSEINGKPYNTEGKHTVMKFIVVWLDEDRVELRYADKHKELGCSGYQSNMSYTYLTDGSCRIYTRTTDSESKVISENNETESPRILRRR